MTPGGWLIMGISVGSVTSLMIWCIYKVIQTPDETEHLHGIELHTPDQDEPDEE